MKVSYILLLFLILSCTNTKEKKESIKTSDKTSKKEKDHEKMDSFQSEKALWEYTFDNDINDFKIKRARTFNADTLTAKKIEAIINQNWPEIRIKYIKTINDTILIKIPNSTVLTQQMGTTGAEQFLISTTFSFTELKGINYVWYYFEMGDHASPGVYDRESWNEN